jgi:tetratricopeptide (TPR) repeat protein
MENSAFSILENEELLSLIRWQLDQGQFGNALVSVKPILQRSDKPLESYQLGAKIYAQLGLFEQAENAFKAFLDETPEALTEKFQYGKVHYDSGDIDKALELWNEVLEKEPTYPPALFYIALGYVNKNKLPDALKYLDVLIKSAPSDNLYFERGRDLIRSIEQNQAMTTHQEQESEEQNLDKYTSTDDRSIN